MKQFIIRGKTFFSKRKLLIIFSILGLINILTFQNCSRPVTNFQSVTGEEFGQFSKNSTIVLETVKCNFNDQSLNENKKVTAYKSSSVPFGSICESEERTCIGGELTGSYPAKSCQILPKPKSNLCQSINEVVGDMRTMLTASDKADEDSYLEFGTFADNYWNGNPETFDRKLEFELNNISELKEFTLIQAAFDDWIAVSINGVPVFYGPYTDRMTKLVADINSKRVEYDNDVYANAELGTSWKKSININILPLLKTGKNTINVRTIVAGAGESFIKFKYKADCL